MTFDRPKPHGLVDLYGCQNPYCNRRLHVVPHNEKIRTCCKIRQEYITTLTRERWVTIVARNEDEIDKISTRIIRNKVQLEKAVA